MATWTINVNAQPILAEGEFVDGDKTKLDGIATGAEVNPDVISQAEAEAGTATIERIWTAERVKQAIAALETGGGGSGDVVGPGSSTDTQIALFDGTTGKLIKASTATIDATGLLVASSAQINAALTAASITTTGDIASSGNISCVNIFVIGTVDGRDIATDGTKLDGIDNNANNYTHPNHTGDVTSTGDGATVIANNAVTTSKIIDSAVTLAKMADMGHKQFLGRQNGAGTGAPQPLTANNASTILDNADDPFLRSSNYTNPKNQLTGFRTFTGTTDTLILADAGGMVRSFNASANTITIPPNASVAFPVATQIVVIQSGGGQTTFAPGSGVTIRSADGKLSARVQFSLVMLTYFGGDEWFIGGDLA